MDPRLTLLKLLDQRPDGLARLRFLGPTPTANVEVCVSRYSMPAGTSEGLWRSEDTDGWPFIGDDITEESQRALDWLAEQGIVLREKD